MKELAKQYDPSQVEDRIYQFWLDGGYFHTKADPDKKPYTIVMPPPNVTGQLHMGHAVDNTMQDILIRTKRMQGYAALWVPGTDHASIATEAKVVEAMRQEGLTKEMVGRDGFLERAWAWKTKFGNRIVSQLKKLGSSCDWDRERFTMDEGCSEAVKEVFVRLYDQGLIYRGNRMVNWCPHCNTSISDAEVEYEEKDGSFWHLLYPVKETGEMLELATTRPETMLGDTAVAINGDDPRYAHLHGCHVVLPLLNKEIPIVCDEHADMTKGTGVVKITPAHDPNDFEVGLRHDLPIVRVFTYDGHMTGAADKAVADALFASGKNTINEPEVLDCGKYAGMTTLEARKAILADLKEGGFLKEIEPLKHEVGTCYRCHSTIEPMVSKQWFVKMEPLAKPAIESVEKGEIKFVPERFTKNYMNWMKGTRDWCISRQLWWGHQIPAWYCDDCGETVVAKSAPCTCPKCGGSKAHPGPRHAGHLVQLGPVALQHPGLAQRGQRGPEVFLPHQHPRHRLRYHRLLGQPHDLLRSCLHRQGTLQHRVHPRHRPRQPGPQDVQEPGQRHRPAGSHCPVRCRRPALHAGGWFHPRQRHALYRKEGGGCPQLCQ